jgi:hypothetical protein
VIFNGVGSRKFYPRAAMGERIGLEGFASSMKAMLEGNYGVYNFLLVKNMV